MAQDTITNIKALFQTGDFPSQADFIKLIDTAVPNITVDQYGAVGDGVTDDTDAFNDALSAAGEDVGVWMNPAKEYLINGTVSLGLGQSIFGNRGKIKVGAEIKTTTTSVVVNGATVVPVTNGALFSIGNVIFILDGTGLYGGKADTEHSGPLTISSIAGNNLTVSPVSLPSSGNLSGSGQFASGSVVIKQHIVIAGANSSNQSPNAITDVIFDGNRANNDSFYSWQGGRIIGSLGRGSTVKNCIFYDIPNECVFPSNDAIIEGNLFYDTNGTCIHISKATVSGADSQTYGKNRIVNNIFLNCMEKAEENDRFAVIENSANSQKTLIMGNQADGLGAAFYGQGGSDAVTDYEVFIIGNKVKNAIGFFQANANTAAVNSKHIIADNIVESAYWAFFNEGTSGKIEKGYGFDEIVVTGNTFSNTRWYFESCSNLNISGNTFINEEGFDYSSHLNLGFFASCVAMLNFSDCVGVGVSNNIFEDKAATFNSYVQGAIILDINGAPTKIKSDASTFTEYAYNRFYRINENTFINFGTAVSDFPLTTIGGYQPDTEGRVTAWLGVNITDNQIIMRADASSRWGIFAGPGCIVKNNTIYADANADAGIRALGANDATGSEYSGTIYNNVNGAIVIGNTIYGASPSIQVGNSGTGGVHGANDFNCQIRQNYITKAIVDDTGGNSTVTDNITLTIDEAVIVAIARKNAGFY